MWDKLESINDWFSNQSNPVKLAIIIFIGVVIILVLFLLLSLVLADNAPLTGDALAKYESSCSVISFQDLNNNLNKYNGHHLKFTGQVVQINENNGVTNMILSVTPVNGGWSSTDLIFVSYNAKTTFNIGDIVNVYGDVSGSYNYISVSLGEFKIPKITARYIELAPNTIPSAVAVPFTGISSNSSNNTTNSSGNGTPTNLTNPTTSTNTINQNSTRPG
jgi:hypothetical protein